MTSTHNDDRGVVRQDHYGAGRQPWDEIVDVGWAPYFAAANVLKYLRRTKDPAHSLESARWYWARLSEMARAKIPPYNTEFHIAQVHTARTKLCSLLTEDELAKLEGDTDADQA